MTTLGTRLAGATDSAVGPMKDVRTGGLIRPDRRWPMIIVALILGNMGFCFTTIYFSIDRRTSFAEEDYYAKAMHWDDTARQHEANRTLGWVARPEIVPAPGLPESGRVLRVRLLDGSGRPIRAAVLEASVFHQADARRRWTVDLVPEGDGWFVGSMPTRRDGLWRMHLIADAVGMRFTHEAEVEAGGN